MAAFKDPPLGQGTSAQLASGSMVSLLAPPLPPACSRPVAALHSDVCQQALSLLLHGCMQSYPGMLALLSSLSFAPFPGCLQVRFGYRSPFRLYQQASEKARA